MKIYVIRHCPYQINLVNDFNQKSLQPLSQRIARNHKFFFLRYIVHIIFFNINNI
jgi:endonuclease IV